MMKKRLAKMNKFGRFVNTDCYGTRKVGTVRWGGLWTVPQYMVDTYGFGWEHPNGTIMKPGAHYMYDGCSIPPILWNWPGFDPNTFEWSGLMHDFEVRHGGLYVRFPLGQSFIFTRTSRLVADNHLRMWIGAEGGNSCQRSMYYRGVRMGSPFQKFPSIRWWDDDVTEK